MTREGPFKRAAKVSLSIRKSDRVALRAALVSAIWTKDEVDDETRAAEARKLTGELPEPISSWGF